MAYSYTTSFNPNNNANPKRNISMEVPVRTTTQFSDLPSCLLIEILLRLPTQTLLICRFVCMDWFRLFCNPYFIKLHLAASPIHYLDHLFFTRTNFGCGRILDDDAGLRAERLDFPLKLNFPYEPAAGVYRCTNSCNGLVCLKSVGSPEGVFVANPVLGELVIIPLPPRIRSGESSFENFRFVLGFNAKTNQYKVMYGFQADFFELGIYTLGSTGECRIINDDQTLIWDSGPHFPHLHGSLHWANSKRHMMYAFDVENEKLKRFSLPRPRWLKQDSFRTQLGIINGYLCVVILGMIGAEIWAMKEYGIEKSWTLMLACMEDGSKYLSPKNVDKDIIIYEAVKVCFQLVFPLNEEEIFITSRYKRTVSVTVSLNLRRLRQRGACYTGVFHPIGYNPSFVSLHDVAKGEQIMVSRLADSGLITEERSEEESEKITEGRRRRRRRRSGHPPPHPLATRQLADMTSTRGIRTADVVHNEASTQGVCSVLP